MHYNDYNRNEFLPVPAPAAQTEAAAPKKLGQVDITAEVEDEAEE